MLQLDAATAKEFFRSQQTQGNDGFEINKVNGIVAQ
jgi:hypothetical protein